MSSGDHADQLVRLLGTGDDELQAIAQALFVDASKLSTFASTYTGTRPDYKFGRYLRSRSLTLGNARGVLSELLAHLATLGLIRSV